MDLDSKNVKLILFQKKRIIVPNVTVEVLNKSDSKNQVPEMNTNVREQLDENIL